MKSDLQSIGRNLESFLGNNVKGVGVCESRDDEVIVQVRGKSQANAQNGTLWNIDVEPREIWFDSGSQPSLCL